MNEQVVMSKTNGQLAIAVPLFRVVNSDVVTNFDNYVIAFKSDEPLAYAVYCDDAGCPLMNAKFVEKHFEFLGDL